MKPPLPDEPESAGLSFLREEPARLLWQQWQLGQRPDLDQFLRSWSGLPAAQLVAVLRVDQWQRWLSGERVPVEEYFRRFPAVQTGDAAIEIMYGECLVREELGENPTLEEYLQRFPQYADSLLPQQQAAVAATTPTSGDTTTAPRAAPPPTIPGYDIMEMVGGGGMGIVYKARHQAADRLVAIKVIRGEHLSQPSAVRRFEREMQAAVRLAHPNVVTVHEASQAGDIHYLVMEYLIGADLQSLVANTGALPVARACDFIRQAASGLAHAHEKGLVHRDIKPANLMVARPAGEAAPPTQRGAPRSDLATALLLGPGAVVKVLDMGLARLRTPDGEDSLTTLTHAGSFMGTPDFMAPEQWEDAHQADIRADLYSLGCTLYFLLTSQVPFPGGSLIQKLDKHRSMTPVPVERLRPDLPRPLAGLVRKLLAKRPSERFQTPAELVEALTPHVRATAAALPPQAPTAARPEPSSGPVGEVRRFGSFTVPVACAAFSHDGALVAAGGERLIRLWETATGKEVAVLKGHTDAVRALAFTPDGRYLVSGSADRSLRVWNIKLGQTVRTLAGHTDAVKSLALSADGAWLLSGGSDRVLRLWDLASGRRLLKLEGHAGDVSCAQFTPDGKAVLSSSWDKTIRLWDAKTGKDLRRFGGTYSAMQWTVVLDLAVAPDGRRFALAGNDNVLRVWDLADGRELAKLTGHTDWVTAVAYSPDGRFLLSASRDRTVRLWDAATGQERCRFEGHTDQVASVVFAPDGRHGLSASADQSVRLWRLPAG